MTFVRELGRIDRLSFWPCGLETAGAQELLNVRFLDDYLTRFLQLG